MTPSLTDQRFSLPSQPSRSLPLKSLTVPALPAAFFLSASAAVRVATPRVRARAAERVLRMGVPQRNRDGLSEQGRHRLAVGKRVRPVFAVVDQGVGRQ